MLLLKRFIPFRSAVALLFAVALLATTITPKPVDAAGKSDALENGVLALIFNATPLANIADNAASSPLTNLYIGLHTADPGDAGDCTTSEISYTGYARQPVARTSGGFTVSGNSVSPAANVTFPESSGGTGGTVTYFSICTASSGTATLLYVGPITPTIAVATGVTPVLKSTTTITED